MLRKLLRANLVQISLLTLVVFLGMLWPFYPLERLENAYFDFWAGRIKTGDHPPVAVVEIDDKSLQAIGAWPGPDRLSRKWFDDFPVPVLKPSVSCYSIPRKP